MPKHDSNEPLVKGGQGREDGPTLVEAAIVFACLALALAIILICQGGAR